MELGQFASALFAFEMLLVSLLSAFGGSDVIFIVCVSVYLWFVGFFCWMSLQR